MTEVVSAVILVNFHHERGNEIEWSYPDIETVTKQISQDVVDDIVEKAMPDQCHKYETDCCYFNAGASYCISCMLDEKTFLTPKVTRQMAQKAVVAVAAKPFYGQIRYMLQPFTAAWFHSGGLLEPSPSLTRAGVLTDYSVLQLAHSTFNKKFGSLSLDNSEALYAGLELQDLILNFGRNALVLFKNQFLEKRTVFYGTPASFVSDTIVSFASLIPGYLAEKEGSGKILSPEQKAELGLFGLPLTIFKNTTLEPYVTLASHDYLASHKSFIVGSSNPMFALGNLIQADLIVDLTDISLAWKNVGLESNCGLSNEDERFIDHIYDQVVAHREAGVSNQNYIGSDAWIRAMFSDYTKFLLSCSADASIRKSGEYLGPFNPRWCAQWRVTENYKHWTSTVDKPAITTACPPGHVADGIQTFFASLASGISQAYDNFHLVDPNAPSVLSGITEAYDNFHLVEPKPTEEDPSKPNAIEAAIEVVMEVIQEAIQTVKPSSSPSEAPPAPEKESKEAPETPETPELEPLPPRSSGIFTDFIGTIRGGLQRILADDLSSLEAEGVTVDDIMAQEQSAQGITIDTSVEQQ